MFPDVVALFEADLEAEYKRIKKREKDFVSQRAVEVAPVVHGRWIKGENWSVTCSVCGCLAIAHDGKNYCPNCGAKMDAKEE